MIYDFRFYQSDMDPQVTFRFCQTDRRDPQATHLERGWSYEDGSFTVVEDLGWFRTIEYAWEAMLKYKREIQ